MRKITERFIGWCQDDSLAARLERTIVQGCIGVLVGGLASGEWTGAVVVGLVAAVLSPVMAAMGNAGKVDGGGSDA